MPLVPTMSDLCLKETPAGVEPAWTGDRGITPGRSFPWITRFPTEPFGQVRCLCNHGVLDQLAQNLVTVLFRFQVPIHPAPSARCWDRGD